MERIDIPPLPVASTGPFAFGTLKKIPFFFFSVIVVDDAILRFSLLYVGRYFPEHAKNFFPFFPPLPAQVVSRFSSLFSFLSYVTISPCHLVIGLDLPLSLFPFLLQRNDNSALLLPLFFSG